MELELKSRILREAEHIANTQDTVRKTAKLMGISKSTVHKDVTQRLRYIDSSLYREVREILEHNKAERHIRGGLATKLKYEHLKTKRTENEKNI